MSISVPRRVLCGLTAVAVMFGAAACGPEDTSTGEQPAGAPDAGGCRQPGPLTRDLLPTFGEETTTSQNPCLGFADLVAAVTGLVPSDNQIPSGSRAGMRTFTGSVGRIADRVAKIGAAVECAYERDRLAIGIYRSKRWIWSIGVVAVVRGDVASLVSSVGLCFLLEQVQLAPGQAFRGESNQPRVDPCFDAVSRSRGDDDYTVIWLGSTNFMCGDLASQLDTGRPTGPGINATVKAVPDVAVRSWPSTKAAMVGRVSTGKVAIVTCYLEGELVSGRRGSNAYWDLATVDGLRGYIADVWLDTGGDVTQKVGRCPDG